MLWPVVTANLLLRDSWKRRRTHRELGGVHFRAFAASLRRSPHVVKSSFAGFILRAAEKDIFDAESH